MSVTITEACIMCGACVWECPTETISPGDPRPVVNQNACTECYGFFGESQCMVVCPVGAVVGVPEGVRQLEARFQQLYPGRTMQDTWVWRRLTTEGLP